MWFLWFLLGVKTQIWIGASFASANFVSGTWKPGSMLPGVPREAKDIATYAVILEDMGCKPFFVSNESAEINRTDLYI